MRKKNTNPILNKSSSIKLPNLASIKKIKIKCPEYSMDI